MTSARVSAGQVAPVIAATTIAGAPVEVPDGAGRVVHLSFRRFAGCPICNLHLRSIAKRHEEFASAGVREVALFHSTRASMLPYQGDLPFDVIADPDKVLYRGFGVESSLRSLVDPRAWGAFVRGAAASHRSSSTTGEGGHLGLPADFLIAASGRVLAAKYGAHADDQWSVDEILALAGKAGS